MLLLLLLIFQSVAHGAVEELIYGKEELEAHKKGHRISAIMFYAPWCSFSKAMAPEWERLSNREVTDPGIEPIYFAKVDCVKHEDIYYDENIQVFPTLKFFFHGLPVEYDGEKDYESLKEFIDFLDYDNVDFDVNTPEQVGRIRSKYLKTNKPLMLGFFTESTPLSLYFTHSCKVHHFIHCLLSENEDLATDYKATMNSVVLIRDFTYEDSEVIYMGNMEDPNKESLEDFAHWLNGNAYPKLIPFIAENKEMMFDRKRKGFNNHAMFVLDPTNSPQRSFLQKLAAKYTGRCMFIFIDIKDESEMTAATLEQLEISRNKYPSLTIISSRDNKVHFYKFDLETFTEANIDIWLTNFFENKLVGKRLNFEGEEL